MDRAPVRDQQGKHMDKAALLEKIRNNKARVQSAPSYAQACVAVNDLQALDGLKDLDKQVVAGPRRELIQYIAAYRRTLKAGKAKRRKHTRG
jgi:hypothetical protein